MEKTLEEWINEQNAWRNSNLYNLDAYLSWISSKNIKFDKVGKR